MSFFTAESRFITDDPRHKRWAIPYHLEAVKVRGKILLENNIHYIKDKTILDLGCHFGTWSYLATKLGAQHVEGIDSSPGLIDTAQQFFTYYNVPKMNYQFSVENVMDSLAQKSDQSLDTILCLGLLYYLPDPYFALQEMKRVCREAIILDTFSAYYCAVQGKDSKEILAKTNAESFELPLLFHILTQTEKQDYAIPHSLKKGNKTLTFLTGPTLPLFDLYFASLGLTATKLDWSSVLQDPGKKWTDLISREGKECSHWTDTYASDIRVSYLLTKK